MSKCYPEWRIIFMERQRLLKRRELSLDSSRTILRLWSFLLELIYLKKKLRADNLAVCLLETILMHLGLKLHNWITTQQDRSSTNRSSIEKINVRHKNAKPTENDCWSHRLGNAGKQLIKESNVNHCFNFRKKHQKVIQCPGKARDLAKQFFLENIKSGSGPKCFYITNK